MNQLKSIARRLLLARGFMADFSDAALSESRTAEAARGHDDAAIRDQRPLLWTSIDNDASRDLDQLSVVEPLPGGAFKVLVAVADVDAVVTRGGAIDAHARNNTVTVYTAGGIFPMLPERLSTDLTSLNENETRLALVIEMVVSKDGFIGSSAVYRAWVESRAKLAYAAVAAWLAGTAPAPPKVSAVAGLAEQLRMQDDAAQALRKRRFERGALSLETPRAEAIFNGDELTGLRSDTGNRAKELIEDLMIASNGVVAQFLHDRRFPCVRRVLRPPARWDRIVTLAEERGATLPSEPDGAALSQFLIAQRQRSPEGFSELSLSIVKLLGRGQYIVDVPREKVAGHFGLAASDYGHSTAPNRRFADLVTHRLLKAAIAGVPSPYTVEELTAITRHCNEQAANAAKVERQVEKSAAAQLLRSHVGERFDGIVTGAADKGTWVRINQPPTEGKIVRGAEGLEVGARVRVALSRVDVEQGFIDFERGRAT